MILNDDERWARVKARDRRADGLFVTGVLTTGIYCRPSCAARHPKRSNVRFFDDGRAAQGAGLRACKRCHPDDVAPDEAAVAKAVELLEAGPATLEELGAATGYSPGHLQRVFKRAMGVSPAAYARARRKGRADEALSRETRVTDAIYEAGYEAPSRFYEDRKGKGMSASAWKKGGAGATIRYAVVDSAMGPMLVAATDKGICRLSFGEDEAALTKRFPKATILPDDGKIADWVAGAVQAVEAPLAMPDLPLDVAGTAFQEAVWQELRKIPPGETRSYAELAAAVGKPGAVRAAGSANGANHVSVLIPCHRVVRSDGSLGGYAWGLEIKKRLLEAEGVTPDQAKLDL
ncbi:bifunctional DNA-binding transcriptional regulator/O6-methylguanine-DNA methyltransferase Ada [Sphingomicrobium clamense]|uniref:Bifunctional DNA-binding transcriptional regulator/O6-methylguanine-DNA methyltransferase Ada n=1 Tax=Sphingomicrobium clamense TaxID=2851013 RepID=A0ABS6V7A0_9SPHN|nr:bifunctional DNA-binding transcriptional regulator/O6-methylguanine-DNA methyltransferase Ada [Sphingomicrobium sp. B8]MBW0145452.1 bifunctional DNA-binding transcriptional regulator/O6-methylguanine-DNA methyltransferase Ada [Sphingomicrobium sp. B8]